MSDHDQTEDNQSFLNLAECQQLKKKITLSSSDLIELTYSEEKFNAKLDELNRQACTYIDDEKYPQAAVYLDQAERVLQYSAGCGKTIERALITTILNNQACLLQRTSDFEQSSNYLEAIIFNINDFLEGTPSLTLHPALLNRHSQEYAEYSTFLQRKISLALYHLRFCALTSHSKNNQLALKSARKALKLLREVTEQEQSLETYAQRQNIRLSQNQQKGCENQLSNLFQEMVKWKAPNDSSSEEFELYFNKTLFYIKEYKKNCESQGNSELQQTFESYSIGNLMQASALQINLKPNPQQFIDKEFSALGKAFRAIHTSMAYFTVATQLRLISAAKYSLDDELRKSSEQYRQSKIYHLISVMLIAKFLTFKSVFYDHAVYSFKNHYGVNLEEQAEQYHQSIFRESPKRDEVRESKSRSEISQKNKTMQIHETKQSNNLDENMRSSQSGNRHFEIAQIQNRHNIEIKKIKQVKSRSKLLKIGGIQSTKTIESDRNNPLHQSKNKENKSKNTKLVSKGKETIKSRAKNGKVDDEQQQRKAIYYGFTSKSRSKSKKQIGIQRKGSKKGLQTIKSGLIIDSKKVKNEAKIDEEYGVKSLGGFQHKTLASKVKKAKPLRSSQAEEQCQYLIKFNKMGNVEQINMKKIKSPRNLKKDTSRRKTLSKDKFNL